MMCRSSRWLALPCRLLSLNKSEHPNGSRKPQTHASCKEGICRSPEQIPMKNAFFKHGGEELEYPTSTFGHVQCIQSYPLPLHRDGAKRPHCRSSCINSAR